MSVGDPLWLPIQFIWQSTVDIQRRSQGPNSQCLVSTGGAVHSPVCTNCGLKPSTDCVLCLVRTARPLRRPDLAGSCRQTHSLAGLTPSRVAGPLSLAPSLPLCSGGHSVGRRTRDGGGRGGVLTWRSFLSWPRADDLRRSSCGRRTRPPVRSSGDLHCPGCKLCRGCNRSLSAHPGRPLQCSLRFTGYVSIENH